MNKYSLISKGLHNNFLYFLTRAGITLTRKGYMQQALLYFLEETRAAFNGNRPVFWCSTFVPSELIYALGGVPFMPEVAAGFTAAVGMGDEILTEAEGDWLNADLCSIHRCGTGLMMKNLVPEPDYIISSSHLCDGAKKYLQYISHNYDCPFYLLETPYNLEGVEWLAQQIKSLVRELGLKQDFTRVFNYSNQAYKYHQQVNSLRQAVPTIFTGEQAMNLVPMEFMSFGSEGGVKYYRRLRDEIADNMEAQRGVIPDEKHRLYWLHLKPYYSQKIFSTLRKMGAVVSFEEFSQLYWEPLVADKPYLSLACKMINHYGWGELDKQIDSMLKIIEDYNLDGVIGFSQWGCRQSSGRMDIINKRLHKLGIPFLNIDGDLVDNRNYREGQLLTRLQAFIELIEGQKG